MERLHIILKDYDVFKKFEGRAEYKLVKKDEDNPSERLRLQLVLEDVFVLLGIPADIEYDGGIEAFYSDLVDRGYLEGVVG